MTRKFTPNPHPLAALLAEAPSPDDRGEAAQYFEIAEPVASSVLVASGIVLTDATYSVIHLIARTVTAERIIEAIAQLEQHDEIHRAALDGAVHRLDRQLPCPSDVALARWQPELEAGFYLGIAIGHRLAGGVR